MITHTKKPGKKDLKRFPDAIAIRHRVTADGVKIKTVEIPAERPGHDGFCPWCGVDIDAHLLAIWNAQPDRMAEGIEIDTYCPECAGLIHATVITPFFSVFPAE